MVSNASSLSTPGGGNGGRERALGRVKGNGRCSMGVPRCVLHLEHTRDDAFRVCPSRLTFLSSCSVIFNVIRLLEPNLPPAV